VVAYQEPLRRFAFLDLIPSEWLHITSRTCVETATSKLASGYGIEPADPAPQVNRGVAPFSRAPASYR